MKRALLLVALCALPCLGQTVTVSAVTASDISHSEFEADFTTSGSPSNLRARVTTSNTCSSGSGGQVIYFYNGGLHASLITPGTANTWSQEVMGLQPSTTYYVCIEAFDGTTWSSGTSGQVNGAGGSITTAALPSVHPALPIAPATFTYTYPATTDNNVTVNSSNCNDATTGLMALYANAVAVQKTQSTTINIPAGLVCGGINDTYEGLNYMFEAVPPDTWVFASTAISSNTINIPNHGFTEGQQVVFGGYNYSGIAPDPTDNDTSTSLPIVKGHPQYIHVVDANNFQVYTKPLAQGGTLIPITGAGGNDIEVAPWPRNLKPIIIRTATPDNQFAAPGTRVNPSWASLMPQIISPTSQYSLNYNNPFHFVEIGGYKDGSYNNLTSNLYFVGIEFTWQPSPDASISSDPLFGEPLIGVSTYSDNIVFDRCYFHALGGPANGERILKMIDWNGRNVGITNSYFDGMHYFHGVNTATSLSGIDFTDYQISAGQVTFGAGKGTLASTMQIHFSGTNTSTQEGLTYFNFSGKAITVLPPGFTGSCSGVTNCVVKSSSTSGGGRYQTGSSPGYPSSAAANEYFVEPVYSSSSSCTSTETITGGATPPTGTATSNGTAELGEAFTSDSSGFICGISFWAGNAGTGYVADLWNSSGTQLATVNFSGTATANAWNTVLFSSPVSIAANTTYIASVFFTASDTTTYIVNAFQNAGNDSAHLHVVPYYVNGNQACDYTDSWPQDQVGSPAVGELGCVEITNSQVSNGQNGIVNTTKSHAEGCQCMVGGVGPGPYAMINNYIEATGNDWHHDDGGRRWANPGDYEYWRNTFYIPDWAVSQSPTWDGNIYYTRQQNEWKNGKRIHIHGSQYIGSYNSIAHNSLSIAFSAGASSDPAETDINIENNKISHTCGGPGVYFGYDSTGIRRVRMVNNLAYDVNEAFNRYDQYQSNALPCSGGFYENMALEDMIVNHNTFLLNGGTPYLGFEAGTAYQEGLQMTNNIFLLGSPGAKVDGSQNSAYSCYSTTSENFFNCYESGGNMLFTKNLFLPNGTTQSQLTTDWSGMTGNYFDSGLSAAKFWACNGPNGHCESSTSDFHLHYDSPYISGGASHATDGTNVGVNMDVLNADLGVVTLTGVNSIGTTTAHITYVAPDPQACSVDYSHTDPTLISLPSSNNSTGGRVADAGGGRTVAQGGGNVRNVTISGLSSGNIYYFRVNCAAQQPTGQFKTN